jgi:haloalkane dehalogenase
VTDAIRTPDVLLDGLPGFDWAPSFRQRDGLRLAHVSVGDGAPVVMLHGEPTWSYLWRKVLPPVRDAGYRVILPDLPGFGRSDKPMDEHWYSYDRHTAALTALVEDLDLRDATFVLHDWGGPIGLRVAVELADRVSRLVVMDTGVFTGEQRMSDAWHRFADFVERVDELPVSLIVRRGCLVDPGDEVAAAYDAPFPSEASKAGARAFPGLVPLSPADRGASAGHDVLRALRGDSRPMLMLWGAEDRPLPLPAGEAFATTLGRPAPQVISGAGHFLQEDRGSEIGAIIADWLNGEH